MNIRRREVPKHGTFCFLITKIFFRIPEAENPFLGLNKGNQVKLLKEAGFEILKSDEVFRPIRFYDVGAFVWFARVIVWEFPDFSVDRCFDKLLELQQIIEDY